MTQPNPRLERREVHYSGHVQGVGFRYSARSVARNFDVAGFVRNLSDGRVQLVVEGEKAEVEGFLADLSSRLGRYIRSAQVVSGPANGDFLDFSIRF